MSEFHPTFRFATSEDIPGIEKLWLEETEWGALPTEFAQQWALAPSGTPRTLIAIDERDGSIIGQCGFMPVTLKIGSQVVQGCRPHSTIVAKTYSRSITTLNPQDQPAIAMYMNGLRLMKDEGCRLTYMVPHPRWTALVRLQRRAQVASFPLRSFLFQGSPLPELPSGCTANQIETWDESIDELWRSFSSQYECGIVRTARTLEWKAAIGPCRSLAVRQEGRLIGVIVARTKGDRMWLICDMLTADASSALRTTLIAAMQDGMLYEDKSASDPEKKRMRKVSILATPLMKDVLAELGFVDDDWSFPLVVERLDDSLSADDVAPAKWYVAAND